MNIINRPRAVLKNFSQRTTAATANATRFDPLNSLQRKQLIIFTVFLLVLTSFLAISGCATTPSPMERKSLKHLHAVTPSLNVVSSATSSDTPPDYSYRVTKPLRVASTGAEASPSGSVSVNKQRLVRLDGEINYSTLTKANELYALAAENSKPIDVIINSPGGSVNSGLYFIEAMHALQAKKIVIRCYVEKLAASMAYTIFTQCNQRYALPYALLLFHAPRISGNFELTPQNAVPIAQGLLDCERTLVELILPAMGITREHGLEWFAENYLAERLFTATELAAESPTKWFTVVSRVQVGG